MFMVLSWFLNYDLCVILAVIGCGAEGCNQLWWDKAGIVQECRIWRKVFVEERNTMGEQISGLLHISVSVRSLEGNNWFGCWQLPQPIWPVVLGFYCLLLVRGDHQCEGVSLLHMKSDWDVFVMWGCVFRILVKKKKEHNWPEYVLLSASSQLPTTNFQLTWCLHSL